MQELITIKQFIIMSQQFINASLYSIIEYKSKKLTAVKTLSTEEEDQPCRKCFFKEKSINCPQGKNLPACFAQERKDNESVYFPIFRKYVHAVDNV